MAEDKVEPREGNLRQRMPWINIFQGFGVALDLNKLILAAGGIIVMALGWWLLAIIFSYKEPEWDTGDFRRDKFGGDEQAAWKAFKEEHRKWALMWRAAGPVSEEKHFGPADVALSPEEYRQLVAAEAMKPDDITAAAKRFTGFREHLAVVQQARLRPAGELREPWWSEDRGPNPYLLLTGQTSAWEKGEFWDWLFRKQIPVLLEPLVKMVKPIIYFFHPDAGPLNSVYFLLVFLWTVLTWGFFGGAIARIAAVQMTRDEKLTLGEAVRYTTQRIRSFVSAPVFPLIGVGIVLIFMVLYGFIHMIPWLGDVVDGLAWVVILGFGLAMVIILVGVIGWPLMTAAIATDNSDAWEASSRAYSYIFQACWQYLWHGVVTLAYGAIIVLFVSFVGSFGVYMSKWGVSQTPWVKTANRDPSYLFVYAPESYHWRDLLLRGVILDDGSPIVDPQTGKIDEIAYKKFLGNYTDKEGKRYEGRDTLSFMNKVGATLVGIWVNIFFLIVIGFGYSYFWSAGTIIYLLLRKRVDDFELDEVYLEEEDEGYQGPLAGGAPPKPAAAPPRPA